MWVNIGLRRSSNALEARLCHHVFASLTSPWLEEVSMFKCALQALCIIWYGRGRWAMLQSKNNTMPCLHLSNTDVSFTPLKKPRVVDQQESESCNSVLLRLIRLCHYNNSEKNYNKLIISDHSFAETKSPNCWIYKYASVCCSVSSGRHHPL